MGRAFNASITSITAPSAAQTGSGTAASDAGINGMLWVAYSNATLTTSFQLTSWTIGAGATPAENTQSYALWNTTGVQTGGTAATIFAAFPGGGTPPAALTSCARNPTGVVTATASSMRAIFPVHQKATYTWRPNPSEEIWPLFAASAGLAGRVNSAALSAFYVTDQTLSWQEP